jgi:hypothetical protein
MLPFDSYAARAGFVGVSYKVVPAYELKSAGSSLLSVESPGKEPTSGTSSFKLHPNIFSFAKELSPLNYFKRILRHLPALMPCNAGK